MTAFVLWLAIAAGADFCQYPPQSPMDDRPASVRVNFERWVYWRGGACPDYSWPDALGFDYHYVGGETSFSAAEPCLYGTTLTDYCAAVCPDACTAFGSWMRWDGAVYRFQARCTSGAQHLRQCAVAEGPAPE